MKEDYKFLRTVTQAEARMLIPLLEDDDIKVMIKHRESGGIMEIYGGSSIFGLDIYVPIGKFNKAQELSAFISDDKSE